METPCGHIDFYPNGGFDQPGCSLFDMPVSLDSMTTINSQLADTMGRHLAACSHNRGIDLYIESLRSTKCQMVAHQCNSFAEFEEGRCFNCGFHGEKCATLGEKAIDYKPFISDKNQQQPLKFYLKTGKKSPFCRKVLFLFRGRVLTNTRLLLYWNLHETHIWITFTHTKAAPVIPKKLLYQKFLFPLQNTITFWNSI